MIKSEILYEPLPIARIGVRSSDDEIVVVKDFSCFAQMIEEYISLGISNIVIPKSSPEKAIVEQMPKMLQNRIKIINDNEEIETVNRVLHDLRIEFDVKINEENNHLSFKKELPREMINNIEQVHFDMKRMAIGFNHQIQVPINIEKTINALQYLRGKSLNANSRIVMAEFEGIINQYKKIEFNALQSDIPETPSELITVFDKLINDSDYIEYSNSVFELSSPVNREKALLKIKELIRIIKSKNYLATSWDFAIKIINVWAGNLIPDSKTIASIFTSDQLPVLVNLEPARTKAIEAWKNLGFTDKPLRRDGLPYTQDNISWMPPSMGVDLLAPDSTIMHLGTAGELLKVLQSFVAKREEHIPPLLEASPTLARD